VSQLEKAIGSESNVFIQVCLYTQWEREKVAHRKMKVAGVHKQHGIGWDQAVGRSSSRSLHFVCTTN